MVFQKVMTEAILMKREMYNLRLRNSILNLLPSTDLFGLKGSARRGVALYKKCAVVMLHGIAHPFLFDPFAPLTTFLILHIVALHKM